MNRQPESTTPDSGASCTCHTAECDVGTGPFHWDPECPRHGLDAQIALADQSLDIDTSYREERP